MTSPQQLAYRPDIDGIRAVAVVAVILFHAFPALCPGGFTGVDIFFVISGYLISGVILTSLSRGDFSFSGFYARRIRRIFPVLFLVPAFCLAAGWYLLTPRENGANLRKTPSPERAFSRTCCRTISPTSIRRRKRSRCCICGRWVLRSSSISSGLWPSYFSGSSGQKRKRGDNLLAGILLIAIASFVFDLQFIRTDPVLTFYNPLARVWELLGGAALARYVLACGGVKRALNRELLSASGAVLIAASLILLNEGKPLPGWWTLLPVVGTALLTGGDPDAWFNRCVLASRPFVAIGLISYPLYLWHWPLLVFLRLVLQSDFSLSPRRTMAANGAVLIVTLIFSRATYRFWEMPLRPVPPRFSRRQTNRDRPR